MELNCKQFNEETGLILNNQMQDKFMSKNISKSEIIEKALLLINSKGVLTKVERLSCNCVSYMIGSFSILHSTPFSGTINFGPPLFTLDIWYKGKKVFAERYLNTYPTGGKRPAEWIDKLLELVKKLD